MTHLSSKPKTQPEHGVGNTKLVTDIKGSYPILNLEMREDIHVTISGQKVLYQLVHLLCGVYHFSLCRIWRLPQPVSESSISGRTGRRNIYMVRF